MAVLNNWQKLQYIVGSPWGTGANGSATISSDPNTRATVAGTATQSTSTLGSAILTNGDVVMLHQTQGTGAGQWELKRVASGGGTTSIVWTTPLNYTYGTGAQCIKIPQYTTTTVSAHSVTAWNGSTGGVEVIVAKTAITVSGALSGTGLGFRLGTKDPNNSGTGWTGEGSVQASTQGSGAAQIGPFGSGAGFQKDTVGGGGGNAATGGTVRGGTATGSADLISITFGGGGSGGSSGNPAGDGANGGGILILISKSITVSAGVVVNGNTPGGSVTGRAGGGGAGGSVLVVCETASLGTNSITAAAGSGGTGGEGNGGAGSVGRIAVHHSGTVTGTTNPTFTDVSDTTLVEAGGTLFMAGL